MEPSPPEKTTVETELPFDAPPSEQVATAAPSIETQEAASPPTTPPKRRRSKLHSLRKEEQPLAPASGTPFKTDLPDQRKTARSLAEIRKHEAITNLSNQGQDPAAHLKKLTAHPALLTPAYLLAFCASLAAWQRALYIAPLSLIIASAILTIFIFAKKKRSRHHAAILTIIIILTLVFGGITYAPLFTHAT
jgi:hypothetical protein